MEFSEEILKKSDVSRFYAGQTVFLTGGSGFLGKAILEKLLRSAPDIKRIYVLLRTKKGCSVQERLQKILNEQLFAVTLQRRPEARSKISIIEGNVLSPNLGICDEDRKVLVENVSIVIHSAASVRFDEPLRDAVNMNMGGTLRVLTLAKEMSNLKSMVHISTAYTNCLRDEVEEKIYDLPHSPKGILNMCEWMDKNGIASATPSILGSYPNTYTCTKAYAEHMVRDFQRENDLPIVIVRPSIVLAAWNEPFVGWLDNINGPSGLLMVAGMGLLQAAPVCPGDICPDFVPLDLVVNTIIVAAKRRADPDVEDLPIFHATAGVRNRISWRQMREHCLRLARKFPMLQMFRYPRMDFAINDLHHRYMMFFHHYLPAQLAHIAVSLSGKPSNIARRYKRMTDTINILMFFYTSQPNFIKTNSENLFHSLSDTDRYLFTMLADEMDWEIYMKSYLFGIRYFLLKEDLTTIPKARKRLAVLRAADMASTPLTLLTVYLFVSWILSFLSLATTTISVSQ